MLTRLRFRRDFRVIVRCLSDKPSDSDVKPPEVKSKEQETPEKQKKVSDGTEKIQELLKLMMAEPKYKESDYKDILVTAPERQKRPKQKDEIEVKMEKIEENITKAASDVAQALGGDVKQTEAELLSRVLGKINQTSTNLSDLLSGMKVDRSRDKEDMPPETRGQQVKRFVSKAKGDTETRYTQRKNKPTGDRVQRDVRKLGTQQQATSINIFSGEPLGIFKTGGTNYGTCLDVWEKLKQRELALSTAQPPTNYFQKMIVWTDQGKVWKFPIDNEQGLEEEQNVHFSEHVFLDTHLEGWCPTKGPIRHFMELVCVGLSKNAFYTVKEKKDHIMWYKEYFESKKDLLSEIGAWDTKPTSESTQN